MRAHGQRRLLWFLDFLLGVGLLGVGAWYFLDVRKAIGDPSFLAPAFPQKAIEQFTQKPAANQNALKPPVSQKELDEIDQPQFRRGNERWWWLYSGGLPPAPPEAPKPEATKAPVVSALEKLGAVNSIAYIPPEKEGEVARLSVLQWKFTGGGQETIAEFHPGDWIRAKKTEPGSLKLVDIRARGDDVYEIVYDVYPDPDKPPEKQAVYAYDHKPALALPDELQGKVRVAAAAPTPGAGNGGGAVASTVGEPAPSSADPSAPVKFEDVKLKIEEPSRTERRVSFDDDSSYDYFRQHDADSIANTVTTQTYRDPQGRVVGLQITGMTPDSPASKFDIRRGDVLVSIDGQPVATRSDAVNIVQGMVKSKPDVASVTVVIDRHGTRITYVVDPRDPKIRRNARYLNTGGGG